MLRIRVLDRVRERLGDGEVGGGLDGRGMSVGDVDRQRHRHGRARDERRDRRLKPAVGEDRRTDPAREVAELLEGLGGATRASASSALTASGSGLQRLLGAAEAHSEGDEPRLRAVVQVALDPAQLRLLDVDGARAGRLEPLDPMVRCA